VRFVTKGGVIVPVPGGERENSLPLGAGSLSVASPAGVGRGSAASVEGMREPEKLQPREIESRTEPMKDAELIARLSEIAVRLEIDVRLVPGEFSGGSCLLRGRKVLLLNSSMPARRMVEVLCRELAREDLSSVFVLPAVRDLIERRAIPDGRGPAGRRG